MNYRIMSPQEFDGVNAVLSSARNSYSGEANPKNDFSVFRHYSQLLGGTDIDRWIESLLSGPSASSEKDVYDFVDAEALEQKVNSILKSGRFSPSQLKLKYKGSALPLHYAGKDRLKELIDLCFRGFEATLENGIGRNFIITRAEYVATPPGDFDKSSLWHFDPTPVGFYKVFIYLTDIDQTGGTEVLTERDSYKIMIDSDYHNCPPEKRTSAIETIGGDQYQSLILGKKGQRVLFSPSTQLHRGLYPEAAESTRKAIVFYLMKSSFHWKDCFDELFELSKLSGAPSSSTWPVRLS